MIKNSSIVQIHWIKSCLNERFIESSQDCMQIHKSKSNVESIENQWCELDKRIIISNIFELTLRMRSILDDLISDSRRSWRSMSRSQTRAVPQFANVIISIFSKYYVAIQLLSFILLFIKKHNLSSLFINVNSMLHELYVCAFFVFLHDFWIIKIS